MHNTCKSGDGFVHARYVYAAQHTCVEKGVRWAEMAGVGDVMAVRAIELCSANGETTCCNNEM